MKNSFVWLDDIGYVYKKVIFIPNEKYDGYVLYEYKWNRINSVIEGML